MLRSLPLLTLSLALLAPRPAAAQPRENEPALEGIGDLADAIVELTTRKWEGARTPAPPPSPRPAADYRLDSELAPLHVHASARVPVPVAEAALAHLEEAAAFFDADGWEAPLPDGSLGGGPGFDLYLTPTGALAEARSDGRELSSLLDAHLAHAVVDEGLRGDELRVAVGTAWGQAVGLRLDPAEAAGWRRATGAYLAWRWTGRFGPADGLEAIQRAPWQPWIAAPVEPLEEPVLDDGGEGGGLLLAMLSQRHDGGSGAFVRGLWQLTRQRTWDGIDLRADPDLWQALEHAVDQSGQQLEAQLEDFAVARWFLGARDGHAIFPALRGLPDAAAPTPLYEVALADLPEHTASSPELAPYGTVYALVDVRGHPARSRLRAWLRGEYGVEWAFSASRLDASGAELGRLSAPPRADDGRSYLPVELTPDTTHVMLAATNLSHRLPDADDPDPNARAVRMIFDLVQD